MGRGASVENCRIIGHGDNDVVGRLEPGHRRHQSSGVRLIEQLDQKDHHGTAESGQAKSDLAVVGFDEPRTKTQHCLNDALTAAALRV